MIEDLTFTKTKSEALVISPDKARFNESGSNTQKPRNSFETTNDKLKSKKIDSDQIIDFNPTSTLTLDKNSESEDVAVASLKQVPLAKISSSSTNSSALCTSAQSFTPSMANANIF